MSNLAPLSASYRDARSAFLTAATAAGARIESHPHPSRGLDGEELAVDVAELGQGDADAVVIVVSATHGVEGYSGSALQRHFLEACTAERPADVALVMIHGLNPYGFSWVRRVNEDNVDLNRNFVDRSVAVPANPSYTVMADLLVPTAWTAEEQDRTLHALLQVAGEIGLPAFQQAVSGGQYDHPRGIFYGGTAPVWSHRWLRSWAATRLAPVSRAAIIDLHTGLGPWGHGELIGSERADAPGMRRAREWWGEVTSMFDGESVSALVAGDWLADAPSFSPATELTAVTIEYGTVDSLTVLQSLRADAWLHVHGDPLGPEAAAIRAQVRAAFADDDPRWLAALWPRFHDVMARAFEHLAW